MKNNTEQTEPKEQSKFKKFLKNKYLNLTFYGLLNLFIMIWTREWWMLIIFVIIFDWFITKKVNWTFWKKRGAKKTKLIEWVDALVFAGIAAFLIRTLFIEAYKIPTSSMEKTLLVGDYLFVSKYTYGPRMPMTPIAVPFTHHTLPLTHHTPAFIDWIQCKYKRAAGLTTIKNDDIVVFNFPVGDTVAANLQATSYYELCRQFGRDAVWKDEIINPYSGVPQTGVIGKILYRPIDKRDNYVKRCVAIAGDTLLVKDGVVYINGKQQKPIENLQYKYLIITDGSPLNPKNLGKLKISNEDIDASKDIDPNLVIFNPEIQYYDVNNLLILPLVQKSYEQFKTSTNILFIKRLLKFKGYKEPYLFPNTPVKYVINDTLIGFVKGLNSQIADSLSTQKGKTFGSSEDYTSFLITILPDTILLKNTQTLYTISQEGSFAWNEDNFGPLWIPQAGATIDLNIENLPLYFRIIDVYENNDIQVKGNEIYINGQKTDKYTFKQNYYFMMGDNRHNSFDSRFWGFVPDDHIVGTPLFIWLSTDKDKSFISAIRANRFLMGTRKL